MCQKQNWAKVKETILLSMQYTNLKQVKRLPLRCREKSHNFPSFCMNWTNELQNGILYRRRQVDEEIQYQLILPESQRSIVLKSLHDDMGHLGFDRTLDLTRTRFFWPKMPQILNKKIKTCSRCVCRKTLREKAAPLVNIQVTRPLELLCIDFLTIELDCSNTKDVLAITDFFTKSAVVIPTPSKRPIL